MLPLGVILIGIGVVGELVGGARFRRFFHPTYALGRHRDRREPDKALVDRLALYLGLAIVLAWGIREVVAA